MAVIKVSAWYVLTLLASLILLFYATARAAEEPTEERFTVWLFMLVLFYIVLLLPLIKAVWR